MEQHSRVIEAVLEKVHFGERSIHLVDMLVRENNIIVNHRLGCAPLARQKAGDLTGFDDWTFSLLFESFNPAHFLYLLMDKFIAQSDAMVAEEFSCKGFRRFFGNRCDIDYCWRFLSQTPASQ